MQPLAKQTKCYERCCNIGHPLKSRWHSIGTDFFPCCQHPFTTITTIPSPAASASAFQRRRYGMGDRTGTVKATLATSDPWQVPAHDGSFNTARLQLRYKPEACHQPCSPALVSTAGSVAARRKHHGICISSAAEHKIQMFSIKTQSPCRRTWSCSLHQPHLCHLGPPALLIHGSCC